MPCYYERDADGLPEAWVEQMRRSMGSTLWRFSTTRMLHEYVERMYLPVDETADVGAPHETTADPTPEEAQVVAAATGEVASAVDAAQAIAGPDEPIKTPVEP